MRRFDVRWFRLAVAAGAIVGSVLVSSVATATDESASIDELVLVVEPAAMDQVAPDPPVTEPTDDSPIGVEQPTPEVIAEVADEVADGVADEVIEPPVVDEVDGATLDGEAEPSEPGAVLQSAAAPDATVSPLESETEHEGGSGGRGNPNRVTFSVTWLDDKGDPISVLDAVLPTDWRAAFELSAESETGKGKPTSATCTYSPGSDVLHCEFDNPGHGSGADGLIVPARPTATYTVTVVFMDGWTIGGANGGPYSCPRSGGGHEGDSGGHEGDSGGHDSGGSDGGHKGDSGGHDSGGSDGGHQGGGHEDDEGGSVACVHSVVMRQISIVPPAPPPAPPVVEPVAEAIPPVVTVPVVTVPVVTVPAATVPAAAPAAEPAPSTLAATGGSFSMILVIAALLVAIGSVAAGLTRRASWASRRDARQNS